MSKENPTIKRGVSFYSYQEEIFLKKMSLEDCIAKTAAMGIQGIEIISEQSLPAFWKLPDSFYEQWHEWMHKYKVTPVCHDLFLDKKKRKDRLMTMDEMVDSVKRDIKHASRLGCKIIRIIVNTEPEVLRRCIPYAEEHDVRLCVEIHAPWHLDHPWIMKHAEMMQKSGSKHVGLMPDFGIFARRFPGVAQAHFLRRGARKEVVDFIAESYANGVFTEYVIGDVKFRWNGNPVETQMAEGLRMMNWTNPRRMLDFMPLIMHTQAKFYEMTEDCVEPNVDNEAVIAVLKEGGYDGYLSSEYEGQRWIQDAFEVDSVEQIRRHHVMFRRLLGEAQ